MLPLGREVDENFAESLSLHNQQCLIRLERTLFILHPVIQLVYYYIVIHQDLKNLKTTRLIFDGTIAVYFGIG